MIWGANVLKHINWRKLDKNHQTAAVSPPLTQPNQAAMQLTTAQSTTSVGQLVPVTIIVHTSGLPTDGATAVIQYDPKLVSVQNVVAGPLYKDLPKPLIDDKLGKITLSGLADVKSYVSTNGILSTVNFTAKTKGIANFMLAFTKGSSRESAVAVQGKQMLGSVTGTTITIK